MVSNQHHGKIFREELKKLEDLDFIGQDDYEKISLAYQEYQEHSMGESNKRVLSPKIPIPTKKEMIKKEPKPKKIVSAEQIRERNITWSLILGVILLLIGGLVVATSNWEQMGSFMKVSSIAFVSILFLIMSWVSGRLLKITQTSFAFLTLGSLFVPIVVLSAGYFHLLGDYLSITGKGNYVLGLMGTLVSLPLYIRNAMKHKSKLFIWISYLFSTLSVGFLLAAIRLSVDAFYLGIMIYNGLLLFLFHKWKENKRFTLFTAELPAYAQLNLIISTLLMLVFFESDLFFSFNLILTAVLYISMVFVYNTKHYQFVFSALIAYGAYQFIENSPFQSIDLVLYSFVGFVYLGFQSIFKEHTYLRKMFQYTSAIVSALAFIFISYKGIIIRSNEPSLLLIIAYLLIAVNYTYLAYVAKRPIFQYLAPIFLVVASIQGWSVLHDVMNINQFEVYLFSTGVLLFVFLYAINKNKYFMPIKQSSFNISILTMVLSIVLSGYKDQTLELSLQLIGFGVIAYVVNRVSKEEMTRQISHWTNPISWVIGIITTYPTLIDIFPWYEQSFNYPFHVALSGLILFLVHDGWKRIKEENLAKTSFYVSLSVYTVALLSVISFYEEMNQEFVVPIMFGIGIALYVILVMRTSFKPFWGLVSLTTLAFYSSLSETFQIKGDIELLTYMMMAPIVLILIQRLAGKKYRDLKPYFFFLAHLIQPLLTGTAILMYIFDDISPHLLMLPLLVYAYSSYVSKREWGVKLFLYLALTMIPLLSTLYWNHYQVQFLEEEYLFVVSSGLMYITWLLFNNEWKRRVDLYIIPFSLIGFFAFVYLNEQSTFLDIFIAIGYAVFNLYLLHYRSWRLLTIMPLLTSLIMWDGAALSLFSDLWMIAIILLFFFILKVAGFILYSSLYSIEKTKVSIDWYSITAFIYLLYVNNFIFFDSPIWLKVLPYLLITYFLYSQVKRLSKPIEQKVVLTLTVVSLFIPYYIILNEYQMLINSLFIAELNALPWLGVTIALSIKTWKSYRKVMNHLQFAVLLLITAYLMADALISNTIWDAVIIGTLSLVSILAGSHFRYKSYFFVGVGVLLLNVFLQTKPYWGNLPWWAYLLIAGSTLIGVASFNEWQKQRKNESGETIIQSKMNNIKAKFKEWD